jgi:hypothetical protein
MLAIADAAQLPVPAIGMGEPAGSQYRKRLADLVLGDPRIADRDGDGCGVLS